HLSRIDVCRAPPDGCSSNEAVRRTKPRCVAFQTHLRRRTAAQWERDAVALRTAESLRATGTVLCQRGIMSDSNAIHYDVWNPAGVDVTDRPSLTGAASDTVDAAGLLSSGIAQPESGMLFLAISDAGALAAQDIQSAWANEPEGGGAPSI